MRLIDIEPFETAKDVSTCEITVWRNGDGYADVATMNTKDIPAVDAVEVCRCKDCEYWNTEEKSYFGTKCRCERFSLVGYSENYVLPSDFCSYGERREDDPA